MPYSPGASGAASISFASAEVPAGAINGVNAVYNLAHVPAPSASLQLYLNGVLQTAGGVDYTLVGAQITYVAAPLAGDTHVAYYRY